ncbi:MAG: ABC transporter ATP-binding protein [Candidatus Bathyarchaeia archaeon]
MEEIIKVEHLRKWFPVRLGFFETIFSRRQLFVRAVDGIDFDIKKGEIFALVGESGSGKTTTGRLLLRLIEPTSGKIFFEGKDTTKIPEKEFKPYRRRMQMIFQDPYESLNPKMTIFDIIAEPPRVQGTLSEPQIKDKVYKVLTDVQLVPPEEFVYRYPHELSGGQRQRVAVARALTLDPEFVVADEPVSMLDASIRAEILNLMLDLMKKYNVTFLYITHDLALARHICDTIAVMYLGKLMERGTAEQIIYEPLHPYTKALLVAVPSPNPDAKRVEVVIKGEIPSPINPPSGCRFHTRCPEFIGNICRQKEPPLINVGGEHFVACHLYGKT